MKKIGSWLVFIAFLVGCGVAGAIERNNLSVKAGPTTPGEGLSLVWVESAVYPKYVKENKELALSVELTAKVKSVRATFDFNHEQINLSSDDGLNWTAKYRVASGVQNGVHVVRYQISGDKGAIQRTVEFYLENPALASKPATDLKSNGWPLTVVASCNAFTDDASRLLMPGQILTSLSKMPWYKVRFEDGKIGWVQATNVKEPTDDYYRLGYESYRKKDFSTAVKYYQNAVAVNQSFVKGYFWLAKSYNALGDLDSASDAILRAAQLDDRDIEVKVMANYLAQKYFTAAHGKYRDGRFNEAVAGYRRAIDLKPDSAYSWLEMGQSLWQLELAAEARSAWTEALKHDPANPKLRALLDLQAPEVAVASLPRKAPSVAPLVADDSLQILKTEKTGKGTKIESAIKSVISLTKSLGTPISEKGWQVRKLGGKSLVSYICEQSGGVLESFEWLVDVDTRQVMPHNDNARILMTRW